MSAARKRRIVVPQLAGQNTPTRHTPPNSSPAVSSAVDPLRTPTATTAPAITSHACHSAEFAGVMTKSSMGRGARGSAVQATGPVQLAHLRRAGLTGLLLETEAAVEADLQAEREAWQAKVARRTSWES